MMRVHYVQELESVQQNLVQMGETTLALLAEALSAMADPRPGPSARASELEAQTDHQHRLIHDQCLNLITLQAPVARDARLVTGILDAIVDLELIGDYAYEIVTLCSEMNGRPPSQILGQMSAVGAKIQECLSAAIDGWRTLDLTQAVSVRAQEASIRAECRALYQKLSQLTSGPGDATIYVDLMLVCRHLERILRHAACVADQAADAAPAGQAG
ncbi:MAG: phosphate uptake regulator PhoU [Bryobacteraceae bacterium]|jgi:phosphate transport system protein